ncbi:MAG: Abi-alpha family protein [Pseudomonadota bacterium]
MSDFPISKDPLSTAIDKGVEEASKVAKEYLDKLIGPGLEEGGGIIADTVAYWRFKNKVNLVLKAKAFLEGKAIDPKRVLPKVIAPLLEAGSLEGEHDMKDRWAAMLASAASEPKSVPPAFPKILSELSSTEAKILEGMADRVHNQVGWFASGEEIREVHKLATWEYEVLMGNLVRLNLCRPAQELEYQTDSTTTRINEWQSYQQIEFTRLGYRFVEACRAPE